MEGHLYGIRTLSDRVQYLEALQSLLMFSLNFLTTINDFLQEHDKGQQVDIAILDFSKAFDTVPHDKLLHKLEQYGIKVSILFFSRCFRRCLQIMCSSILQVTDVSDTGL
jgi:hypothetical protein